MVKRLCNRCIGAFAIVVSAPAYACAYGALCTERALRLLVCLSVKRKGSGEKRGGGGPSGTRTPDLGIKSPLLYQLS